MSQLTRLIYASRATFAAADPVQGVEPHVGGILVQSRRNNNQQGIGGVLYFGDGHFFQVLEGEYQPVMATYRRIQADSRHHQLRILSQKTTDKRLFADWSMKYVPLQESVRAFLKERNYRQFTPLEFPESDAEALARVFYSEGKSRVGRRFFNWRALLGR